VTVETFLFDLYDKNSFQKVAYDAVNSRPRGILLAPIFYHEVMPLFEIFKREEIPYVFFNTNIPEVEPLSFIGQNLYQSGRVSAELMYAGLGHKHDCQFAVLHVAEDIQNSVHLAEKEKGFRDYLKEKDQSGIASKHF